MAVARQTEHSVLTSLSELRAIEEERVADERAAVQAAHLARIAAREAEERALADAAAAKIREMHEAALAIEHAKVEAEREARLKIEATEAAERARQQAILAETRLAQEMELRRAEVAKKRPTWMVAVTAVAMLAAFALIYVAIDRTRTSEQAKERARIAVAQEREMRRELEDLTASLLSLEAELDTLSGRTSKAIADLAKVESAAQAAVAKKEIDRLRAEERTLRKRQELIRTKKEHIKRTTPVHIDKKCLTQALC